MTSDKKVLLATHVDEPSFSRSIGRCLRGYEMKTVSTVDEALRLCAETQYDLYVIEINLGKPESPDITPIKKIYEVLQKQNVEKLEKRCVGFAGTVSALESAQQMGIQAVWKTNLGLYISQLAVELSRK